MDSYLNLVSIILPLYRSERHIRATLRSVLAQTHENWELVIVDDGSPDDSAAICRAMGDERLRIFRRRNTGSCRARNFGITEARGDFIAFIDHDDTWLPDKLEKHLAHLRRRPAVGVSYGPSAFMDVEGRPLGLFQVPRLADIDAREIICRCPIGNGSVPLIRREVLEEVKFSEYRDGVPEDMYFDDDAVGWEDVELWFRIAWRTKWTFEGIPDCLTWYRIVPDGIAGNAQKKQMGFDRGLERARRYAPEFIARHGGAARAYHLRYLARRLIHARNGAASRSYMRRALSSFPGMLLEEPGRTLVTLCAAYALGLLPRPIYDWVQAKAIERTGRYQRAQVRGL
jgi:glycosyltransferase involved in cell wall biosynthesis